MTEELVAKVAATVAAYFGEHDTPEDVARAIIPIVRADTLEEAARVAEDRYTETDWQEPGQRIATAIRQLGKGVGG